MYARIFLEHNFMLISITVRPHIFAFNYCFSVYSLLCVAKQKSMFLSRCHYFQRIAWLDITRNKRKKWRRVGHMRRLLRTGFTVGYLTEKYITWSLCARGSTSAKYNIVPHSLPRNSIRICIRDRGKQKKNFMSSFARYIF